MENVATPAVPVAPVAPVPPAATPTAETIALPTAEVEQLRRDAARAASNQSKADRYDRIVSKSSGKGHFIKTEEIVPPTAEERADKEIDEDRKAERGLMALAADPSLREILDADPTLRSLLSTNPLGVLPVLAPDALDAEDAINLVKENLLARKKPATPPAPPAEIPKPGDNVPPAGGINTSGKEVDEEYEKARKIPNTEQSIASMIKIKAGKLGKK